VPKVKLRSHWGEFPPGSVVEMDADAAKRLIDGRGGVLVKDEPETANDAPEETRERPAGLRKSKRENR
jgi:hypothetical protein